MKLRFVPGEDICFQGLSRTIPYIGFIKQNGEDLHFASIYGEIVQIDPYEYHPLDSSYFRFRDRSGYVADIYDNGLDLINRPDVKEVAIIFLCNGKRRPIIRYLNTLKDLTYIVNKILTDQPQGLRLERKDLFYFPNPGNYPIKSPEVRIQNESSIFTREVDVNWVRDMPYVDSISHLRTDE